MLWNTPEVKQLNSEKIRKEIQLSPKCTKSLVSRKTSLSVATCNNIINDMLKSGELLTVDREDALMGRPATRFEYNAEYHHVLGVAVHSGEKDYQEYAVGNALGKPIDSGTLADREVTADEIISLCREMTKKDKKIDTISVGIPGVATDGIVDLCDVKSLDGIPLEKMISDACGGIETVVQNDMDFISYGVYDNVGSRDRNLAVLMFPAEGDSYVGAGIVLNGKVLRGATHFSGELSYVAEAFGIDRKEMLKIRQDRDRFLEYVGKIAVVIISTIDPAEIILMGNGLKDSEIGVIRETAEKIVTAEHMPKIMTESNINAVYVNGLLRTGLNRLDFPISEPMYVETGIA